MTLPTLCGARFVVFLVAGADKAEGGRARLCRAADPRDVPASLVRSTDGETMVLLDRGRRCQA